MSKRNYGSKRNTGLGFYKGIVSKKSTSYILDSSKRLTLRTNFNKFTQWEKEFYLSIKSNFFSITSSKQWEIILKLLNK